MSELIKSFLTIALCGSLLGILIPENKLEKTIGFLSSTVILLTLLTLFINYTKTVGFENLRFEFREKEALESDMQQEALRGIKYSLENEIYAITKRFTGKKPFNIKTEIEYENNEFILKYIKIYIQDVDEKSLADHIAKELRVDSNKTNIIVVTTEHPLIND